MKGFKPVLMTQPRSGKTFWESVLSLIGHFFGSALIFLVLAGVAWLLGVAVDQLHKSHPFNPAVLNILHRVEVWILYIDIVLSGMVLLTGAYKFVIEIGSTK